MPRVAFTPNLNKHLDCPPTDATGSVVRDVLDAVFEQNPKLRGYIVDDQGEIRQHVLVFVDGVPGRLETAVSEESEVYVMQALSGG